VKRRDGREPNQIRGLKFTRAFTDSSPGSVLVEAGRTVVLCTVSITDQIPMWLQSQGGAWLTAEYSMLPGSTHNRKPREARIGRADGRSLEIGRLIGRCLRAVVDLKSMPEITMWVDCDVLSADGGTRTTAINGACLAVFDALLHLEEQKKIRKWPMNGLVSAISVGLSNGNAIVDLDYKEDHKADVDMNVVCMSDGRFVEIQSSAEGAPFSAEQFDTLLAMAKSSCEEVTQLQNRVLGL
jgi:ribonuclease PH